MWNVESEKWNCFKVECGKWNCFNETLDQVLELAFFEFVPD